MPAGAKQVTDAVYHNGLLRPLQPLDLKEGERVRVVVEKLESAEGPDREALLAKLKDGIVRMNFRSNGSYPTRDQLHDRD